MENLVIIHFYNPCKRLELGLMEEVEGQEGRKVVWCGDFNAHNPLWGGKRVDGFKRIGVH